MISYRMLTFILLFLFMVVILLLIQEESPGGVEPIIYGDTVLEINMDLIVSTNSDKLPPRIFTGMSADIMCSLAFGAVCAPPFSSVVTDKRNKMGMCLIQKSMSTVLNSMFCYLSNPLIFIESGRNMLLETSVNDLCKLKQNYNGYEHMMKKNNIHEGNIDEWLFFMVTRDPLDRFLSGFVNRCIRASDDCFGCKTNMTCFMEKEIQRAQIFAATPDGYKELSMEDIHIFPQNWRCSMEHLHYRYHFVRYSAHASQQLLDDLQGILRNRNYSQEHIDYISSTLTSGRTPHSTYQHADRVYLEKRLRNSPYLMEMLVRLFYYDYVLLNYPLPQLL